MDSPNRFHMGHWHGNEDWKERTCAEETICGTTHCLAGWLQVCATDPKIRSSLSVAQAGFLVAPIAAKMFYRGQEEVKNWLTDRAYVADYRRNPPKERKEEGEKS